MASLVQAQHVLGFRLSVGDTVTFAGGSSFVVINFDGETWDDMGCPDEITVTIEPGATLGRVGSDEEVRWVT